MVADNRCGIRIKGQGQIYVESVTQTALVFLTEVFPIWYNDCMINDH